MKTTNYTNTFIEAVDDCPAQKAEIPSLRNGSKTIVCIQYEIIKNGHYTYTSDDVLFQTFAIRNNILKKEQQKERACFFSKGQPCMRSSPLTKRYGWGIHYNSSGKIALHA